MAGNVVPRASAQTDMFVPLERVRTKLAVSWLCGASIIVVILVLQSLLGKYRDVQQVWGWALPTIMPTLGMIVTVLGYTALTPDSSNIVVRTSFYRIALWLSIGYLLLVLLTILVQPWSSADPLQLMNLSNLWLGPCQSLVASALGVLFVSKRKR